MDNPLDRPYVIDPELSPEVARINQQGHMLTQGMGGVLPES